jgi:hypothetical protein
MYYFTREHFEKMLTAGGFEMLALHSSHMLATGEDTFAHGGYLYAWLKRVPLAAGQ